jgi:plasmid stability protein
VVGNLEEEAVRELRLRARSAEAERREILRQALLPSVARKSLKDLLLSIPQVGDDVDFERISDCGSS